MRNSCLYNKRMKLAAVIFDLDGVITSTAQAHAKSWKQLFDAYLQERAEKLGETWRPFEIEADYLPYVDGKPRYDGVAAFLKSRNIELPRGTPQDSPNQETFCGLGNRKNEIFQKTIEQEGAQVYPSTLQWIEQLKAAGIKVAMATSSKNGPLILSKAGLSETFPVTVDGNDIERLGLKGKPDPDLFLEAARRLQVNPKHSAVVEDALSGVAAGKNGHFGVVIGVVRNNSAEELKNNGADLTAENLNKINLSLLESTLASKMEA